MIAETREKGPRTLKAATCEHSRHLKQHIVPAQLVSPPHLLQTSDVTHIRKRSLSRWRTIQQYRQLAFRALAAERPSRSRPLQERARGSLLLPFA